jgi:hypothetical protein
LRQYVKASCGERTEKILVLAHKKKTASHQKQTPSIVTKYKNQQRQAALEPAPKPTKEETPRTGFWALGGGRFVRTPAV